MDRRWFAAVSICAVALAAVSESGVRAQQPAFRAGTALVEVDAVVHDKAGRFVPDLSASDFEVLDDGAPRAVELITIVRRGAPTPTVASPAATSASGAAPASSVAPHPRVFIAVFDDEHLTPGGFKRVQAAARSLFARAFQAGDIGGVVLRGEMANKRLTSDRDELLAAIGRATPSGNAGSRLVDERDWPRISEAEAVRIHVNKDDVALQAVFNRACTDDPTACANIDVRALIQSKSTELAELARVDCEKMLTSLSALFNGLQRFAGPKVVLLLTEGFVAEESWPIVERAVAGAARADARLYTLDARATDRTGFGDRLTGADPGNDQSYAMLLAQKDMNGDATNSLAVDTGGFVVRNANNFDRAVAQIADEASTYYVLGFQHVTIDGRFHKLTVRLKRPGLTVRARRGYIATAPVLPAIEALATPLDGSALPGTTGVDASPALAVTPAASVAPAAASPRESNAAPTAAGIRLRPDAVQHADMLAGKAPRDDDATKGWEAYQRGDLESARSWLAAAASRPGARPWVSYALGQAQYGLRSYHDAEASWEHVRTAAPEFEPVYFDLVDAYLQLRDYDRATALMRDASKRWPADADVYEALGVVEVRRGALDDAVMSFQQAIGIAPQDATGYFNLANALELRYRQSRRWVATTHSWHENAHDRDAAIENYQRYLRIGGPLESAARAGLERLDWK